MQEKVFRCRNRERQISYVLQSERYGRRYLIHIQRWLKKYKELQIKKMSENWISVLRKQYRKNADHLNIETSMPQNRRNAN